VEVKKIFEGQLLHLIGLLVLLGGIYALSRANGFYKGSLWGISTGTWFVLLIADTVVHQVYVWFCWRLELYGRRFTRWFGRQAFVVYAIGFAILIILRPLLIIGLSWSNRQTLSLPSLVTIPLAVILAVPALYLLYSVKQYFGFLRAFGLDHFDPVYRNRPMVKGGIFRFTDNGMYFFGLLGLWIPGLFFSSVAGIIAALFSHLYIWVHFYCTEKPDMEYIYGG
jgi:hypothetical protein